MTARTPTPGAQAAIERGCKCHIITGADTDDSKRLGERLIAEDCPLHGEWPDTKTMTTDSRTPAPHWPPFQARVHPWMLDCFGAEIASDRQERNHRFLEEALELVQANGCAADEAHQLVDYVYGRDQGEVRQEVGGVMVTLAALCLASGLDMHEAGEIELARVWRKIDKIRAKQAAKPKHSPLPQ